jgi:hypothetical protein
LSEPVRVEAVKADGPDSWVLDFIGLRLKEFRRIPHARRQRVISQSVSRRPSVSLGAERNVLRGSTTIKVLPTEPGYRASRLRMASLLDISDTNSRAQPPEWFAAYARVGCAETIGFRSAPGGVHLSKTMMLAELTAVLDRFPNNDAAAVERSVVVDNLLGKPTGTARRLALARLNTLYGILTPRPIQFVALRLWPRNAMGRPLLALLCALAREPLLRQSAQPVLDAPPGVSVRWPDLAAAIAIEYPDRYSPKMMKSLAQNCVSSWTQSGHLRGRVNKRRCLAEPSAETAAFAALLGTLSGFGGPALLRSPWMRLLDRPEADLLSLLRRAESAGLVRVRAGGGVVQIDVRRPMAQVLEVPNLVDC